MRVGIGYDIHPFRRGRPLILGGARVDHPEGLDGHSDADVLTHAVIDALLGAAGLGDIGILFPADDVRYKDVSSLELLSEAVERLRRSGLRVSNVDCTLIAQNPRLAPHIAAMRKNLAGRLGTEDVNVKGKSPEGIGSLGAGGGIAALAVAAVEQIS